MMLQIDFTVKGGPVYLSLGQILVKLYIGSRASLNSFVYLSATCIVNIGCPGAQILQKQYLNMIQIHPS